MIFVPVYATIKVHLAPVPWVHLCFPDREASYTFCQIFDEELVLQPLVGANVPERVAQVFS